MIEDSALTLKKAYDIGKPIDVEMAKVLLGKSELVGKLLVEPGQKPESFVGIRAYEWRLIELSEIPFTGSLTKVQDWINLLVNRTYTTEGFSLTGNRDGLLSCHNAMITTLLDNITPNVPVISLTNVPGVSVTNEPGVSPTNVPQ